MEENWYSLAISVLKQCTPEQAFELFVKGKKSTVRLDNRALEAMGRYKELGLTWKQIGEIFGLEQTAACNRFKRYKKLKKTLN